MGSGGPQRARSFDPMKMKKGFATESVSRKSAEVKEVATKKTEETIAPAPKYERSESNALHSIDMLQQKVGYEIQASEQRLESKIDKSVAEVKQEMNQRFVETDRKIDNLESTMNQKFVEIDKKIDNLESTMNQKFVEMDKKIDNLEFTMNLKFAATDSKIAVLDTKIDGMGKSIDGINKTLDAIQSDFRTFMRVCLRVCVTAVVGGVVTGIGALIKIFFFS